MEQLSQLSEKSSALFVVLPVYNEQAALRHVLHEWVPVLRAACENFVLCAINDGSTDSSLRVLTDLSADFPELEILDQSNSGHGRSCVRGYHAAVTRNAEWIFQIDSDGKCDPHYFPSLWDKRNEKRSVYGFRYKRDDGLNRLLISRVLTWFVYAATGGTWVRDPNVPYRLMHVSTVAQHLALIPDKASLSNIFLAALQERYNGIDWIDIRFRNRRGGHSSLKPVALLHHVLPLYRQLRQCFSAIRKSAHGLA